jgi:hypothetical protein
MGLRTAHALSSMEAAFTSKAVGSRIGAFTLLTALSEICKATVEPYLVPMLHFCLDGCADRSLEVHTAALKAGRGIINNMCPFGARFILPQVR